MASFSLRKNDPVFFTGLIALLISTALFLAAGLDSLELNTKGIIVWPAQLAITIVYLILLITSGRLQKGKNGLIPFLLFIILFFLTVYAVNKQLEFFEISTILFCIELTVLCCVYIVMSMFVAIPRWIRYSLFFASAFALVMLNFIAVRPGRSFPHRYAYDQQKSRRSLVTVSEICELSPTVSLMVPFRQIETDALSIKENKNGLQNATLKSGDLAEKGKGHWHAPTPTLSYEGYRRSYRYVPFCSYPLTNPYPIPG